jgi:hypothetical protein
MLPLFIDIINHYRKAKDDGAIVKKWTFVHGILKMP